MTKNDWIRADEQKPLENEAVLGICFGFCKANGCYMEGAYEFVSWSENEGWVLEEHGWEPVEVKYWQPLPMAPWERKEDDDEPDQS